MPMDLLQRKLPLVPADQPSASVLEYCLAPISLAGSRERQSGLSGEIAPGLSGQQSAVLQPSSVQTSFGKQPLEGKGVDWKSVALVEVSCSAHKA